MDDKKSKALISIKKAQSLLELIAKMVAEDRYCIDIMQQNLAAIGLLRSAHRELMANHLDTCFRNAMASRDENIKKKMTEEILQVSRLYNK